MWGPQALGLAAFTVTMVVGGSASGAYLPPPGDVRPVWSPDGTVVVFASRRQPTGLHIVSRDGVEQGVLPGVPEWTPFAFSPGWRLIAYSVSDPNSYEPHYNLLRVSRPDGSERRTLAGGSEDSFELAWSPEGTRLAFVRARYTEDVPFRVVWTIGVDGNGLIRIADRAASPEYSRDGKRLLYVAWRGRPRRPYVVVQRLADGITRRVTALESDSYGDPLAKPRWSPNGLRIAFAGRTSVGVVGADGSRPRRYPVAGPPVSLEWSPDGRSLLVSGFGIVRRHVAAERYGYGVHRLDLATGRSTRLAAFGTDATFSPDGSTVAFTGVGECKDRFGIYRVSARGGQPVRLTNGCRIEGTEGPDSITGTQLVDVVHGLGGNDVLTASVLPYPFGDDLYGGPGDDVVRGDVRSNILDGGPGRDQLAGNSGADTLRGGPDADVLSGGGGPDVVLAEDGARDDVSCGTNSSTKQRELDAAFVDRLDRVDGDCELVYRAGRADLRKGRTRLAISVWATRDPRAPRRGWTLRCNPAGGTLPAAAAACRRLTAMRGPLAPIPPGTLCSGLPLPRIRAVVRGTFAGKSIVVPFSRSTDCETRRWNRHRFLLEPR